MIAGILQNRQCFNNVSITFKHLLNIHYMPRAMRRWVPDRKCGNLAKVYKWNDLNNHRDKNLLKS